MTFLQKILATLRKTKVAAFLQKIFLARYSFFAGAILFLLPIVVLQIGIASPLLAGLFDLDGFWEMFWATFFAYLLALSVFVTFRISSVYGPLRCGFADIKHERQVVRTSVARAVFFVVLFLPLPMIINALWLGRSGRQAAGAFAGFATALGLAIFVDLWQRAFNTFQGERPDTTKHLLLPFSYPFSSRAEKNEFARRLFSGRMFQRVQSFIDNLDDQYGAGIINRECKPASIYPGIVLAVALFFAFLFIYLVGLVLWIWASANGSLLLDLGITTMSYVLVLITLLCWLLVGVAFYADRFRLPTIILLLLILIFSQTEHTYRVEPRDPSLAASTPYAILAARKNDPYIILVAANGGGIQSAAWTAEVLTRIDEACREVDPNPNGCRNSVALISGVSGGSVGTMYYVDGYGGSDPNATNEVVRRSATWSSLAYVGGGIVFNDTLRNIPVYNWVFGDTMDRGKHLQRGWIRNRNKAECDYVVKEKGLRCEARDGSISPTRLGETLASWGDHLSETRRPAVIFNATLVESGKRLLFSSARFGSADATASDWLTFNQMFGDQSDVDVVEAVRLSASFPFVTPAAARIVDDGLQLDNVGVPGLQDEHVVDGGYFDNYGLMSVRDFLNDAFRTNPFDSARPPKVIVIQIYGDEVVRDVNGSPDPNKSKNANLDRFGLFSWYRQTLAPLNTMLNVRQTSQYTRNEETYRDIVRLLEGKAEVNYFVFKFSKKRKSFTAAPDQSADASTPSAPQTTDQEIDYESPPLSWHLTRKEKEAIEKVSCDMRRGEDLNENTTNWKGLMDLLRNPLSSSDWKRCEVKQ